jgi:NTE family protein
MSATPLDLEAAITPVHEPGDGEPEDGIGLCLSGGGFRAMVFHLGALLRLNEVGLLSRLNRISSVSGGSITSAFLALRWQSLNFEDGIATNLLPQVVEPIREFAHKTIDAPSVAAAIFLPGNAADKVAQHYSELLFGDTTLQSLPDAPRFIFNATNVQSGALLRFSKPYVRDYKVGKIEHPSIRLAQVVAASSAFPPMLSPALMRFDATAFNQPTDESLVQDDYRTRIVLTDGGVYDNLGLETVWKRYKTVLVSDGGAPFTPDPHPADDWIRHSKRVIELIDHQVRSLRKRQLIASYQAEHRKGCYWGITSDIASYGLSDALPCPVERSRVLAAEPTRLARLSDELQERIINWGYAVCDAALRRHFNVSSHPQAFPYPRGI